MTDLQTHVMLDLETWGNGNNALPVSIGAVKFNREDVLDRFHVGIDPESAPGITGLKIDAGTIMWWFHPDRDEARKAWLELEKHSIFAALDGFGQWFGDESLPMWGNGATFDNVIMRNAFKVCGFEYPAKFWHDSCYRTLKNAARDVKLERVGVHHAAVDDAESQARHLIAIWKKLGVEA